MKLESLVRTSLWVRPDIPCLRPEGGLLFKAKACRPKDEQDFEVTLPWHPDHPWIKRRSTA